ncbi:MAG TPA: DUF2505 domain-containing protein [Haliangiales bacterium]|nr:DUF2505 domain-containing protein [Haliangiales bacterium]
MRAFTLVQDIATDPENHWKLFLDPEFDRKQYLEGFRFPGYEILEHEVTDDAVIHRIRVTPKLDVPAAVARALGARFGYTEDGKFDKKTGTWRSRMIPNILADRLRSDAVVRVAPAGEGTCRRTCELSVEARIFGIGGLVESALEKNLRKGWEDGAAYMNEWVRRHKA